jgi:DNA-directed RNA polymerase subunit alpha
MISLPKPPQVIDKKENQTSFIIEALYPGYGFTIGNALRRVLLSSLPGAAVAQVKIKGVDHEFTTLPGVLEDIVTICLNLKKLRFRLYSDEPQRATLSVHGEKKVTGADFKLPSQLELINKDLHIATLTDKKANLEMEILAKKGIGYEPREMREKEKLEIGQISLDAIYTPVRRVSYKVEDMRVGERTDFDRLFIEIETDGSITPEEALMQATEILIEHFSLIFKEKVNLVKEPAKKKEKQAKKPEGKLKKVKKTPTAKAKKAKKAPKTLKAKSKKKQKK